MAFRSEILIKLDKKGRVLLPAAFRDELPADDRGAFVLYHSPNLPGVVNGNSRAGFDAMLDRLRAEALGPKGALKVALDDEAFDPAGYLSASARTIAMEPDGRFSLPAEFAGVLEVGDGVMLVGKGDKFQLWNPGTLAGPPRFRSRQDGGFRARPRGRRRMNAARHVPVLAREVVDALQPRDGGRYLDGTFGAGGYATAMLDRADCQVIAIDRDPDAIAAGQALAERYAPRLRLIEGRFGDMAELLAAEGVEDVDGVALDLGVSSMQFDQADRGFSFRASGPLDMRMDRNGQSAADLVNEADESELADIIWRYGEERKSRRVARAIVEARKHKRIETTGELADIVRRAVGPKGRDESDPATRTFQALRIAVNDELGELERGLAAAEQVLAPGGRLAVVSFHSLEDRAVKEFVRARAGRTPGPSRHAPPRAQDRAATLGDLTRKPVLPSAAEIAKNPRARSARLRVAEKLSGGGRA